MARTFKDKLSIVRAGTYPFCPVRFSVEQLCAISEYKPVVPDFAEERVTHDYIQPIIAAITADRRFRSRRFMDSGYGNYHGEFFCWATDLPDVSKMPDDFTSVVIPGVLVCFSVCLPVAIFGRTDISVGCHGEGSRGLEPHEVRNVTEAEGDLEAAIISAVGRTPYQFLTREEAGQPLPAGVEPFEYCLCAEPWDKVMHVLFANTD